MTSKPESKPEITPEISPEITWADFEKIDMRIGTIIKASEFNEARRPAYILEVDFGDEVGVRKSSAQITAHYELADLVGKQVLGVVNFPKKQIGPIMSECLITGVYDADGAVVLMQPNSPVPNGAKFG